MAKSNLSSLSDEELAAKNEDLMKGRADAEKEWRDQQLEVQAEVTRRADAARLERMADTLSQDDRDALTQYLAEHPVVENKEPAEEPAEG